MRGSFMTPVRTWLGYPYPLGATWMGNGVNFAIFSEHATGIELCLFDNIEATEENFRIPVTERTDQIWHVFLPDVGPGQLYGFRVAGPRSGTRTAFQQLETSPRPLRESYRRRSDLGR